METLLRMTIIFVWCMFFGFFSVMGYLDETMTAQKKTVILVGLLLILTAYLAFEWVTRSKGPDLAEEELFAEDTENEQAGDAPRSQLDERVLRRLHLYTKDNEQELQAALATHPRRKSPALSTPKK